MHRTPFQRLLRAATLHESLFAFTEEAYPLDPRDIENVFWLSHSSLADVLAVAGMSAESASKQFGIPYCTLQGWLSGESECEPFLKYLLAEMLGLITVKLHDDIWHRHLREQNEMSMKRGTFQRLLRKAAKFESAAAFTEATKPKAPREMRNIFWLAHASIEDLLNKAKMATMSVGRQYAIPYETVIGWAEGKNEYAPYFNYLLAESLNLVAVNLRRGDL